MGFIVPGRNNTKLLSNKSKVKVNESNILKALHYNQLSFRQEKKLHVQTVKDHKKTDIYDIPSDVLKRIFLELDISDVNKLPVFLRSHFNYIYSHDSYWRYSYINMRLSKESNAFILEMYEYDCYLEVYLNSVLSGGFNNVNSINNIKNLMPDIQLNDRNTQILTSFVFKYAELYKKEANYQEFLWAYMPMFIHISNKSNIFKEHPWCCYMLEQNCLLMYKNNTAMNLGEVLDLCLEMSDTMYSMKLANSYTVKEPRTTNKSYFRGCFIRFIILNMVKNKVFHVHEAQSFANFIKNLIIFVATDDIQYNSVFDISKNYEEEYDVKDAEIRETFRNKDIWICILRAAIKNINRNEYEKQAYIEIYNLLIKQMNYQDENGSSKIPDVMGLL